MCSSRFISLTDMFFVLQWSGTAKLTTIRNLLPIKVKLIIKSIHSFNYPKSSALLPSKLHCHIDKNNKEMSLTSNGSVINYKNNIFYLTFLLHCEIDLVEYIIGTETSHYFNSIHHLIFMMTKTKQKFLIINY